MLGHIRFQPAWTMFPGRLFMAILYLEIPNAGMAFGTWDKSIEPPVSAVADLTCLSNGILLHSRFYFQLQWTRS